LWLAVVAALATVACGSGEDVENGTTTVRPGTSLTTISATSSSSTSTTRPTTTVERTVRTTTTEPSD
jgi:hypothetical protein